LIGGATLYQYCQTLQLEVEVENINVRIALLILKLNISVLLCYGLDDRWTAAIEQQIATAAAAVATAAAMREILGEYPVAIEQDQKRRRTSK
jgi:hypothetical protein